MGQLIILGSGYAVPEEGHDNTHLFIQQGNHGVLVDCASNPTVHLKQAGIAFNQITDLILTHFHPDHVSGMPLLLMDLWLLGRKQPLNIYGPLHAIDRAEAMMKLYDWKKWPNFFPVMFHRLPEHEMILALFSPVLKIFTSPVKHLIPTIGLRIEFLPEEKVVAYSCDTEPCPQVVELAARADILIHEATGASVGHSSPAQAAQIARQAGVRELILIHYAQAKGPELLDPAKEVFDGSIRLAKDFMRLEF
ncbi:MAG TPA: ribonuclease Z [Anaerolineaceae bacterium]|nr:ribonuclease Z [Anaerolineaceae bacterium]